MLGVGYWWYWKLAGGWDLGGAGMELQWEHRRAPARHCSMIVLYSNITAHHSKPRMLHGGWYLGTRYGKDSENKTQKIGDRVYF